MKILFWKKEKRDDKWSIIILLFATALIVAASFFILIKDRREGGDASVFGSWQALIINDYVLSSRVDKEQQLFNEALQYVREAWSADAYPALFVAADSRQVENARRFFVFGSRSKKEAYVVAKDAEGKTINSEGGQVALGELNELDLSRFKVSSQRAIEIVREQLFSEWQLVNPTQVYLDLYLAQSVEGLKPVWMVVAGALNDSNQGRAYLAVVDAEKGLILEEDKRDIVGRTQKEESL